MAANQLMGGLGPGHHGQRPTLLDYGLSNLIISMVLSQSGNLQIHGGCVLKLYFGEEEAAGFDLSLMLHERASLNCGTAHVPPVGFALCVYIVVSYTYTHQTLTPASKCLFAVTMLAAATTLGQPIYWRTSRRHVGLRFKETDLGFPLLYR